MTMADQDLDSRLRQAMSSDAPDVSQLVARVRQEMQPRRSYRSFALSAIAATLLIAIFSGALMLRTRRSTALAADAACKHVTVIVCPTDFREHAARDAPPGAPSWVERLYAELGVTKP